MAKKDKNTMDLPEVKDIPGQEHVRPPRLGELGDTTASSSDEEGSDVDGLGDDDDLELSSGSNVSRDEKRALASVDSREVDTEDEVLNEAALDNTDDDGDPLNEEGFGEDVSGDDLDVPESDDEEDEYEEEIGEGDEENNEYSTDKNEDDSDIDYNA
ncbi:MAG TPA: hypothetical protein VGS79_19210 [Puia sp.]|nr:hypothetical protein [Puia sp.]